VLRVPIVVILVLMAGLLSACLCGAWRWTLGTRRLRARLDAAREPVRPPVVDFRELEALPAPVRRYFRAVLRDGQPMVAGVRVRHRGTFNMSQTAERWTPFTSDQMVVTRRPGFDWDGRIAVLPGIPVRVHDAYVAGEGILRASLLGIVSLAHLRGTDEVAAGELMRFFAEAGRRTRPRPGSDHPANGGSQYEARSSDEEVAVQRTEGQPAFGRVVGQSRDRGTKDHAGRGPDGASEERLTCAILRGRDELTGGRFAAAIERCRRSPGLEPQGYVGG
jgi:Family of unknown function (DUF6920)